MPDTETKPAPSYLSAFEPKPSRDDHAKVCGTMLLYLGMPLASGSSHSHSDVMDAYFSTLPTAATQAFS